MLAFILAASFGVYHWHQRREEKLKSHVAFALIKIAYGVNWARKDCEEPEQNMTIFAIKYGFKN